MNLLVLLIIVLVICGGGLGYYNGNWAGGGIGIGGILFLLLVLYLLGVLR